MATRSRSAATWPTSASTKTDVEGGAHRFRAARASIGIFELTTEALILLLRILLVAVLYLFLLTVVLAIGRDVHRTAEPRELATSGRLVVVHPGQTGLQEGEALGLEPRTSLGRSSRSTIVLDDTYVSSEHATVTYHDGAWWLSDRDSTNGTLLNDAPVNGEVALKNGDVIGIGQIRLRVTP
jgi:hypothetical protein